MELTSLVGTLTDWIVAVGARVNDMPGMVGFGLGLFTWFTVEQFLRRVMSGLRWVIIIGALGALGLSVPYVVSLMTQTPPPEVIPSG